MRSKEGLITTVGEARKLLGKQAEMLSDEQIIDCILNLTAIASSYLNLETVPKN
jgi:hypothetical protein